MTKIQRIKRIQNLGVFHDFTWATDLSEFHTFNLIYGLNGSGKTTLSNLLRGVELKNSTGGQFLIESDAGEISSQNLATQTLLPHIKVFNNEFVSDSVFTVNGTCSPIFFLGEENATKRKQIEQISIVKFSAENELSETESRLAQANDRLNALRTNTAARIKELLRSAGSHNPYNNYDKRNLIAKFTELKENGVVPKPLSDHEQLARKGVAAGSAKLAINEVSYDTVDLIALNNELNAILSQAVVSEVIEALRANPNVSNWVEVGLRLHGQLNANTCQFCENPVTRSRITALEKHFNTEYGLLIAAIEKARLKTSEYHRLLTEIEIPDEARIYDDFVLLYRSEVAKIEGARNEIGVYLKKCDAVLKEKLASPFAPMLLSDSVPARMDLSSLNKQISCHNERTADFDSEVKSSRAALEVSIIADKFNDFNQLEGQINSEATASKALRVKVTKFESEMKALDRQIRAHRIPGEQINSDLASYLGRKDISLSVEDSGYRILRNGVPAVKLSEGEKNALALIYFLKSIEDREFDRPNGIVVIDDPVSSLDANALFYAFSFIQERTKNVGQLFITTHSFGLLRLIRKWFFRVNKYKKRTKKEARMYMLNCGTTVSGRRAVLAPLDPLLAEYESEYSYLFSQVVKGAEESNGGLEKFYHYPNIARRLLEAFLSYRLPHSGHSWVDNQYKSDMHSSLNELDFDVSKTNRILNFLNAHSHNARPDGTVEHDESILLETPSVLVDVMKLIEHADKNHYEQMLKLVGTPDES